LKQATLILALLGANIIMTGCGASKGQATFNNGSGNQPLKPTTHLLHRSLVSNYFAGALDVMDATQNRLTAFSFAAGAQPTYLQPSPDGTLTFVNNTGSNTISSFSNNEEAVKATIILGGWTESFVTSVSNKAGFAAVYNLSNGNPPNLPGGIVRFNPTDGSLNTDIPFHNVRHLALDTAETHLLAFTDVDDDAHWVDLTATDPATQVPPYYTLSLSTSGGSAVQLSRPVAAFFSADNTKAYVLSCGSECGGSGASSVTAIDTTTITPPVSLSTGTVITATVLNQWTVNGARRGLIDLKANKLYVAGSTTTFIDGGGNNVQDGFFTVIDLANPAATPLSIPIGPGVKRWIRNINGTFWIASLNCGVQSCVSMVNPTAGTATVLPAANGDATGISLAAIKGSSMDDVYTIEGGELFIYDQSGNPVTSLFTTDVKGQASDVLYIN
jgi:DNA-binding beta-propeller fold protein YncE